MRRCYLIRHAVVETGGQRLCIGRTDLPLSARGELQARRLGEYFAPVPLTAVYASPLTRAARTAALLSAGRWPVHHRDDLRELDMGEWDGLAFEDIRARYPALYRLRGEDPAVHLPPGGESPAFAQRRMLAALQDILAESEGDVAVVAHCGVNQLLLCALTGLSVREWKTVPQPYGCLNILAVDGDVISPQEIGTLPFELPSEAECVLMLQEAGMPEPVAAHCQAVANRADELVRAVERGGMRLDAKLVRAACLLHDIARTEPDHAAAGAALLRRQGFHRLAAIVALHHDLTDPDRVDEAAAVYLADKLVQGTCPVSLEERFAASRERCRDAEALAVHDRRYAQAVRTWNAFRNAAGREI